MDIKIDFPQNQGILICIGIFMGLIIVLLVYCLYGAWRQNRRLQAEVNLLNDINKKTEILSIDTKSEEESDLSFYKHFNRSEAERPKTPPSSPTIEDYDSEKRKKSFRLSLEKTLSPLHKNGSDNGKLLN
jgi:biopolymer transport protein ExbB/TolQ